MSAEVVGPGRIKMSSGLKNTPLGGWARPHRFARSAGGTGDVETRRGPERIACCGPERIASCGDNVRSIAGYRAVRQDGTTIPHLHIVDARPALGSQVDRPANAFAATGCARPSAHTTDATYNHPNRETLHTHATYNHPIGRRCTLMRPTTTQAGDVARG
jgi:hypothetical protein